MWAWAGIHNQWDTALKFGNDMMCGRGADAPEAVRAGCGERPAKCSNDFLKYRMGALPHSNCVSSIGHQIGHQRGAMKNKSQWARPKSICKGHGKWGWYGDTLKPIIAGKVHNQWIAEGAAFCLENFRTCDGGKSIRRETIDGFRGKGDRLTGLKKRNRFGDPILRLTNACLQPREIERTSAVCFAR